MIKDTQQKLKAVRYCVALGYVPYLEVVVRYPGDTGNTPSDLTDIDVLGIRPGGAAPPLKIVFDCKSSSKLSGINRALWARGLMHFVGAAEGFVILGKPPLEAHRLAGNSFGVRVFSEQLFDSFASSASTDYRVRSSYIENIDAWNKLVELRQQYPALAELVVHLTSTAPLEHSGPQGLRSLMSRVRAAYGELDPAKIPQRVVYKLTLAQFVIFVGEVVREFHNIFDPSADKANFESVLRYFIWGGRENYDLRQRLNVLVKKTKGVDEPEPFEFPAWGKFVEYVRGCLDAPLAVGAAVLPLMDMAFRDCSTPTEEIDRRLAARLRANNRIRQFAISASAYLIEASRLPKEFHEAFVQELNAIMEL